jgi:hypothetical protein
MADLYQSSCMKTLTVEQIYDALQASWWQNTYPQGTLGVISPATMLYWTDKAGNIGSFPSSGYIDPDNTGGNMQSYVEDNLMWQAAHQLQVGQCVGSITNVKPKGYNPLPIYFK